MNKALFFYCGIYFLLFWAGCAFSAGAQEPVNGDTSTTEPGIRVPLQGEPVPVTETDNYDDLPVEEVDSVAIRKPSTAAFYSAVLPGLGQAYNNSHWKIPLIYLGGTLFIYRVNYLNRIYSTSLRNMRLIQRDPTVLEVDERDEAQWNRIVNASRRNRDYMIIIGGIFYALNIVEAYVDAHLQDFDVNDDLAIRLKPALMAGPGGGAGAGIALTFNFK